jgi:ArsR family transcriptional regulator, arsenate/arsenite/antimonite-responsive transcriptional repressor / arsenate reductase (thioredoxin)
MARPTVTPANDYMSADEASAVFAALSQETRLETYRLLLRYQPFGLAAGDIARLLAVQHNTLSTHMAVLQNAGLVRSRREGRSIIFAAAPARFAAAQAFLAHGLSNPVQSKVSSINQAIYPVKRPEDDMSDKVYSVLILCTGNSARSILAEAIINREGRGRFRAYSAGSQPKGEPNPVALDLLSGLGYDISGLRSKSWTEFAEAGAPKMDFVITVCDAAAGEACPYWPGHPLVAHWGIPDPVDVTGTHEHKRAAFQEAYRRLMNRITAFVNLPVDQLGLNELKARLVDIGRMDGATELALSGKAA